MIKRFAASFVLAVSALCMAAADVRASDATAATAAAVDRTFRPLIKEHDVPGLAVGVTAGGKQHFFYFGVAAKDTGAPVTADTLFEIGSISKMFTATLAGYALAKGALSLDDHPGRTMAALRGSALDQASLVNLATYTAGLPLHLPNAIKTPAEMEGFIAKLKIKAAPGTMRLYSNPSAGLVGYVAALAMNGNFTDLIETQLLPKLGVRGCFIRIPPARLSDYAQGYKGNTPRRMGQAVFDAEAYGLKCSASGLLRFVEDNIRPDRLDALLRRAIETTQVGYFRVGEMVQGFGWEQYPWPVPLKQLLAGNSNDMIFKPNAAAKLDPPRAPAGPALFNKTGGTAGFSAYAAFVPAREIGIVILANKSIPTPARVTAAHAVLAALSQR
ncbi:MAG: class C beta-lactamase [Pseudorhodoplanes sp.]|uniref:class C beta-lactamase n=1 Tax=Pseudorhodoplanes sp. TaxID=1934341 RepID=UPI003D137909